MDINERLLNAAKLGDVKLLKQYVDAGADINAAGWGNALVSRWTALHFAAEKGYLNCVQYLVEQLAEIDCRDSDGWTPLHVSAKNSRVECSDYLVRQGANVYARTDSHHETPIDFCIRTGQQELARFMLRYTEARKQKNRLDDLIVIDVIGETLEF